MVLKGKGIVGIESENSFSPPKCATTVVWVIVSGRGSLKKKLSFSKINYTDIVVA
jgi:hypothetical protein